MKRIILITAGIVKTIGGVCTLWAKYIPKKPTEQAPAKEAITTWSGMTVLISRNLILQPIAPNSAVAHNALRGVLNNKAKPTDTHIDQNIRSAKRLKASKKFITEDK